MIKHLTPEIQVFLVQTFFKSPLSVDNLMSLKLILSFHSVIHTLEPAIGRELQLSRPNTTFSCKADTPTSHQPSSKYQIKSKSSLTPVYIMSKSVESKKSTAPVAKGASVSDLQHTSLQGISLTSAEDFAIDFLRKSTTLQNYRSQFQRSSNLNADDDSRRCFGCYFQDGSSPHRARQAADSESGAPFSFISLNKICSEYPKRANE